MVSNNFKRMAVSPDLSLEIEDMIKKINHSFKGFSINKIQASKIVAWKSKTSRLALDEKRLIEILGGNNVQA